MYIFPVTYYLKYIEKIFRYDFYHKLVLMRILEAANIVSVAFANCCRSLYLLEQWPLLANITAIHELQITNVLHFILVI